MGQVNPAEGRGVVVLERATIEDVDFTRASFEHLASSGCVFVNCDFRGLAFDRRLRSLFTSRRQSVFRDCRFDACDLRHAGPGQSRFERCSFEGARIERWTSLCGEFVDCRFAGPIVDSKFYGLPHGALATQLSPHRATNEFRGNDLSAAQLVDTVFVQGLSLSLQRWPEGDDHVRLDRIHQRLQRGHLAAMRWNEVDARNEALAMLHRLSIVYGEQSDLIRVRLDTRLAASSEVQRRVWELLATVV